MSEDLVQRRRKNKGLRGFVHQVRGGRALKRPEDLVQRRRKNKGLRGSVHQVCGGRAPKMSEDLVQRKRKNKGLRGFVHQVHGGRALKSPGDLVQRRRKNKGLRGIRAPSPRPSTAGRPAFAQHCRPRAPARAKAARPRQKKTIKNGTMVRQVHRSGALNWYAMWGRVRISSVLSERSVLQPFC